LENEALTIQEHEDHRGKKRSREEAARSAGGSTPPVSPPHLNPNKEWKKSKAKTEDLLAMQADTLSYFCVNEIMCRPESTRAMRL
jgi:hypothetical protein